MSEPIARPVFFEGQILAAADLEATVDHARGESARDRRYLHTPGIAEGLALTGRERTSGDTKFKEVTLSAGVAIDRTGRQVVLAADTRLDETLFDELRVEVAVTSAEEPPWYPVFVRGVDTEAPAQAMAGVSCGTTAPTRVTESAEITFGRPGQELDLDAGEPPEPADGPGDPRGTLILVGYVQWQAPHFTKVELQPPGKIRPRYAGVRADEVVARAGVLSLRSGEEAGQPALVLDQAAGGSLLFGLQNASGGVIPAFTVDAQGNLTTEGKIRSAAPPGTVQVQSGVATDGVILPLPPGIKPEDVEGDKVALHTHLTPRFPGGLPPPPPSGVTWVAAIPLECRLEEPSRRVHCVFRWLPTSGPFEDRPGACDYLVMATVPPEEKEQP